MKLTIDTTAKTIKVEEQVSMGDLQAEIEKLLPKEWKEYQIIPHTIQLQSYPVYPATYPASPAYPLNPFWYNNPVITCNTGYVNN